MGAVAPIPPVVMNGRSPKRTPRGGITSFFFNNTMLTVNILKRIRN